MDNKKIAFLPKEICVAVGRTIELYNNQVCLTADKYHFLRILPKRLMDVVETDGRYYLEYREKIAPNKCPTEERILKRMDKLLQWIADCEITPAAIDICSSHISGYLPKEMYPWIEEVFLEKLGQMWQLELV